MSHARVRTTNILLFALTAIFACVLTVLAQSETDSEPKFSTLARDIALQEENATVHHPLYVELAMGTLPVEKYKVLIQQNDIYVANYLKFFGILAKREDDPDRKKYLQELEAEAGIWAGFFDKSFDLYGFHRTKWVSPAIAAYNELHNNLAATAHISESLAAGVACFTIWHKMGEYWSYLANLSTIADHPYRIWLENNIARDDVVVSRYVYFVDGYYDRLGNDSRAKQRMLDAYGKGVQAEFGVAQGVYETAFEEKFSVMVKSVAVDTETDAVYHPMYVELVNEKFDVQIFKVLIQQYDLLLKSVHQVYEMLAAKEKKSVLKARFTQSSSNSDFFQWQYNRFNFTSTHEALPTTQTYIDFILEHAGGRKTISEGLAAIYAHYTVWHKMGLAARKYADLLQNPSHRYRNFIEYHDPSRTDSPCSTGHLAEVSALVDGYYERLGDNVGVKHKMFAVYKQGVGHELSFAAEIYNHHGVKKDSA